MTWTEARKAFAQRMRQLRTEREMSLREIAKDVTLTTQIPFTHADFHRYENPFGPVPGRKKMDALCCCILENLGTGSIPTLRT